jgi:hypothetical protein
LILSLRAFGFHLFAWSIRLFYILWPCCTTSLFNCFLEQDLVYFISERIFSRWDFRSLVDLAGKLSEACETKAWCFRHLVRRTTANHTHGCFREGLDFLGQTPTRIRYAANWAFFKQHLVCQNADAPVVVVADFTAKD